jgi:hypothetical protein
MADYPAGFFQGTEMPTAGWWEALWSDPSIHPPQHPQVGSL